MTCKMLLAAGASLAIALGGCQRSDDTVANDATNEMAFNEMAGNEIGNDIATGATAPLPTADFIAAAGASDLYEIEAGKLAAEKGSTQAIKDFGTMLQADHKSSTEQLKAAVAETPSTMPVPELTAEQTGMLDALKAASGADFDKLFLDQQVQAHGKALDLLNGYAAGGEAEPLKQFATKAAPVVQTHLDRAKSMQQ